MIELGYRVTIEAAARPAAQSRDDLRAGALYAASQLAYFMGDFDRSKQHGLEALAIAEEVANPGRAAAARQIVGHACQALGELAAAREHFEASVALARAMGRKDKLSFALNSLAGLYSGTNDFEAAEPLCAEALALARELDDRESVALGLAHLGSILLERADAGSARKLLDEGISVAREIGSMRSGEYALEVVRGFAIRLEQWADAARMSGAIARVMDEMGLRHSAAEDASVAEQIAKARAALGEATFAAAEAGGRSLSYAEALDEAQAWLSRKI